MSSGSSTALIRSQGRRVALAMVAGVALGDLAAMTVSLVGLGAPLAASASLFTVMKWIGAAYLVYLGLRLWQSKPVPTDAAKEPDPRPARGGKCTVTRDPKPSFDTVARAGRRSATLIISSSLDHSVFL
ncbi:MAG: LysE family transporter [bacterium]|nr:LysE family transporter [bacterium]